MTVDRIIEKPIEIVKVQEVKQIIEVPVEVVKTVEVIKEVEKIVEIVKEEENCDCLTGGKFVDIWNQLFMMREVSGKECLKEKEFVAMI